jgi:nucleotide-binding universal stress UspA family protein
MPQEGRPEDAVSVAAEDTDWLPPEINTRVAHPARVYDFMLGGKDNFAADRALAGAVSAVMPSAPFMARANRAFLGRAVRYLAEEAGIRQFLDIGTGIPAAGNTHEVAQAVAPQSRVVYVDNDPIVLAHARALMTSGAAGATAFIQADLREPDKILADPALRRTLDLGEPIALILVAILMYVRDEENPGGIMSALLEALPSGSYLTISHPSADFSPEEAADAVAASERSGISFTPRTQAEVAAFFAGLELVDPGVVPVLAWHPDSTAPDPRAVYYYGAMGRKP